MTLYFKNFSIKKIGSNILKLLYSYRYLIGVILICGGYVAITFNQTMPFAEGWYTYYAKCINEGEIVYKDFDYLFTPLYIYFISFFTKVFGYKIIALRVLGIIFFVLISIFVFLALRELFNDAIATISTVTAMFFLQSEVVQIFYDYIRFMDIFSCATIYFLIKFVKSNQNEQKEKKFLILAGLSNALFLLVKQNMGVLFFVYTFILIIFISFLQKNIVKKSLRRERYFLAGFLIPIIITIIFMFINGSLASFFEQTGASAISAKGGIVAILFGWLKNNQDSFYLGKDFAIIVLLFIAFSYITKNKNLTSRYSDKFNTISSILFSIACIFGLFLFAKRQEIALLFDGHKFLSTYSLFLIVFPLFIIFVTHSIVNVFKGKEIAVQELLYITITGSYFAISYGCGMSAGLAEGQATIGVAFIIGLLLYNCNFRFSEILKSVLIVICLLMTLQCAAKKMNYTYNWWGMDESNLWDSDLYSSDIELLEGIKMSEKTLNAYETIYHVITENTNPEDPIYCFPQIPIFYNICDRSDPGVKAKVQWFDVASDSTINEDIITIEKNPPKAILIYETSEYAYEAHERLFRSGEISATRRMKQFLLNYATTHGYTFYGRITATDNNNFLLYYKTDDDYSAQFNFEGKGTVESPYLIKSVEDVQWLQYTVANGNDYAGVYFEQTCDLDFSQIENWKAIGEYDSGYYFKGIYNGAGHVIKNMVYSGNQDVGFFGQLGGIVCNLGIIDSNIDGAYSGSIAAHAVDSNAMIINCFSEAKVSGIRAGGIADDFSGKIINCVFAGECYGREAAGAISYSGGYSHNVFSNYSGITSSILNAYGDMSVKYCNEEYMCSNDIIWYLNKEVSDIDSCKSNYLKTEESYDDASGKTYEEWMSKITLLYWRQGENGYPIFRND